MGYPGAYTVSSGKDSKGETIALKPVEPRLAIRRSITRPPRCSRRATEPGSCRERSAGWTDSIGSMPPTAATESSTRITSTCRSEIEAVLGHGARVGACRPHVPIAARRELRRPSIHHRGAGAIERRPAVWPLGLRAGTERYASTRSRNDRTYGAPKLPCFDYQTLGDELDACEALVAILLEPIRYAVERIRRRLVELSGRQTHLRRSGLGQRRDYAAEEVSHRRAAGKLANFTWITPICANSDHANCGGGYGPSWVAALVNPSARASFGTRRSSSCSGTTGAASTIPSRRPLKITTAWAFAFRCS